MKLSYKYPKAYYFEKACFIILYVFVHNLFMRRTVTILYYTLPLYQSYKLAHYQYLELYFITILLILYIYKIIIIITFHMCTLTDSYN